MARLARIEVFAPDEVAIVHVMNRVVRRCFLLGDDPVSGKNFDHRKTWIEDQLRKQAALFGIDLLGFAILSNHFHLILRSRPDCVAAWDDAEVARRWLMLCPVRKDKHGHAEEPNEMELNFIRNDQDRLKIIRSRLSDLSWWMRLLCQHIAVRANRDDDETGKFFQSRYKAVRLLDDQALLACAAYVDLNPIRAALAETLETSDFTSVQRRIQSLNQSTTEPPTLVPPSEQPVPGTNSVPSTPVANTTIGASTMTANRAKGSIVDSRKPDGFLSPLALEPRHGKLGPVANTEGTRCSDKGYLSMSLGDYLDLVDWTGRQIVRGNKGRIPKTIEPILKRLKLDRRSWCDLVGNFGKRFFHVAGAPKTIDATASRVSQHRYYVPSETRKLYGEIKPHTSAPA